MVEEQLGDTLFLRFGDRKMIQITKNNIDLIVYDFDGVMTDNLVLVSEDGKESVVCSRADGLGVEMISSLGIDQMIISTETNAVVEMRAKKIGIPVMYGVSDKQKVLCDYCLGNHISLDRVLYVGNDVNDLEAMLLVGFPICPSDAYVEIKNIALYQLNAMGGERSGA